MTPAGEAPLVARLCHERQHLSGVDSFVPDPRAESNEVEDGHAKIDKRKWRWCRKKAPPCTISLGFDL
jgi:hypothetical protein